MIVRPVRKDTTPVVVLAGFLGAGKTTMLNHILRTAVGAKIAVIVNDFGAVNIDAMLITAQTDSKMELTNGCVCCAIGDGELEEAFQSILSTSSPDVIIVEASGLAEPDDIAKLILLSPTAAIAYGGLVYVVDALQYHETLRQHPSLIRQVQSADSVVISKTEHASEGVVAMLIDELRAVTDVPVIPVERGEVAPALLFDIPLREEVQLSLVQQGHHAHDHLHDMYQSMVFESDMPLAPERFRECMNALPRGVYRVKGSVHFGMAGYEQKFIVQAVGGRWDMYAEEWAEREVPRTELVVIGAGFAAAAVEEAFRATVGESVHMVDIRRYTESR